MGRKRKTSVAPPDGRHGPLPVAPEDRKPWGSVWGREKPRSLRDLPVPPNILLALKHSKLRLARKDNNWAAPDGDLEQSLINWFQRPRRHRLHWNWQEGEPPQLKAPRNRRAIKKLAFAAGKQSAFEAGIKSRTGKLHDHVEDQMAREHARQMSLAVNRQRKAYRRRRLARAVDPTTVIMDASAVINRQIHPHAVVAVLPDGRIECILCIAQTSRAARQLANQSRKSMSEQHAQAIEIIHPEKPKRERHRGVYGSRSAEQESVSVEQLQFMPSSAAPIGDGLPVPTEPMELNQMVRLAQTKAHAAIEALTIALSDKKTSVAAANALLDRAYGKAPLSVSVASADKKAVEEMTTNKILEILAASGVTAINGKSIEQVERSLAEKEKEKAPVEGSLGSMSRGE